MAVERVQKTFCKVILEIRDFRGGKELKEKSGIWGREIPYGEMVRSRDVWRV